MQTKNANNKMSASVPTCERGFLDNARYRMSCHIAIVEVLGVILFEKVNGGGIIELLEHQHDQRCSPCF